METKLVKVRNLRPRILRGVVGMTEYEVLVGGFAEVPEPLARLWASKEDVELFGEKAAEPATEPDGGNTGGQSPDADGKTPAAGDGQASLPGTDGGKTKSGFFGR